MNFALKTRICVFKMMNFAGPTVMRRRAVSKNDELCIKNEELCIKNEEFCIKNDAFGRTPDATGKPKR